MVLGGAECALVAAGRADGRIRHVEHFEEFAIPPGMPKADRPGRAAARVSAKIEIAAGIHDEALEAGERARRQVDREPLRHGAEIQQERPGALDRPPRAVEAHVTIADASVRVDAARDALSGTEVAIEAAGFHPAADRRIERAAARLGDRDGEPDRLEQDGADGDSLAGTLRQPRQLTRGVESAAAALDLLEPREGGIDAAGGRGLNRHDGAHQRARSDHFALPSASTTA